MGCGTSLLVASPASAPTNPACPDCGTEVPPGFRFCGGCGRPVEVQSSPPAARPSTPRPAQHTPIPPGFGGLPSAHSQGFPVQDPVAVTPTTSTSSGASSSLPRGSLRFRARLVLLQEDGSEGGALTIQGGPQWIGRNHGPPFDEDAYLDPDHASLTVVEDGLVIDDSRSLNGVFFKIEEPCELQDQDQFRVGQELLRYQELNDAAISADGVEKLGSPNPGFWGRLAVLATQEIETRAIPLEASGATLGRESGQLTFPNDGYVSARHCRVYADEHQVWLEDLGSSNGTYMRVRPNQLIAHGRLLLIGQQLFRLEPG